MCGVMTAVEAPSVACKNPRLVRFVRMYRPSSQMLGRSGYLAASQSFALCLAAHRSIAPVAGTIGSLSALRMSLIGESETCAPSTQMAAFDPNSEAARRVAEDGS